MGRVCLWPNAIFTGESFQWRVPIDDDNLLSVTWQFVRVPNDRGPYVQIPTWHSPVRDPQGGRWLTDFVMNQDYVAWVGQGQISDRENEHLGSSDRGVILMRRRFLADLAGIEQGADPKAVIHIEPDGPIELPVANRRLLREGLTTKEFRRHPNYATYRKWLFHAGQPRDVTQAYEAAMGFADDDQPPLSFPEILHSRPTVEGNL